MRLQGHWALALALLLCACNGQTGNTAENAAAEANQAAPAPSENAAGEVLAEPGNAASPPAGAPAPEPPANGSKAPEPSGEVTLSAAPARTAAGGTMTLTLRNGSSERVGYNLCTSGIETSAGRAVETGRICTMELRTLEPGRSANYAYELPDNLADGTYRFLTSVERMGSGRRGAVRSNSFEVR